MGMIPAYVNESYGDIFNHVSAGLAWKYGLSRATCEDIASNAMRYVLTPLLEGKTSKPATAEDFERMATKIAKYRALDELERIKRNPVKYSLDDMIQNGSEDAEPVEHRILVNASLDSWRSQGVEDERQKKARVCMKLLPMIFKVAKTAERDQQIYRAVALEKIPVKQVEKMFAIKANHIHQIVHKVGRKLAEFGPAIVDSAFSA